MTRREDRDSDDRFLSADIAARIADQGDRSIDRLISRMIMVDWRRRRLREMRISVCLDFVREKSPLQAQLTGRQF